MMPLRSLRRALAWLLVLGTSVLAPADDMVPLDLRFTRLTLSNGRVLHDATLTSFNRQSGLIYVMAERQLRPYPAALFPAIVQDQIDTRLAEFPSPTDTSAEPPPSAPDAPPPAPPEPAPVGTPERHAIDQAALEAAMSNRAREAALRHFRYDSRQGSGYTTMTHGEADLDPPVAIPGWPHRYRVKGIVYFNTYDSVGESFQNRRRGVEVILEAPTPNRVKVLEVNTNWTPAH